MNLLSDGLIVVWHHTFVQTLFHKDDPCQGPALYVWTGEVLFPEQDKQVNTLGKVPGYLKILHFQSPSKNTSSTRALLNRTQLGVLWCQEETKVSDTFACLSFALFSEEMKSSVRWEPLLLLFLYFYSIFLFFILTLLLQVLSFFLVFFILSKTA